MSIVFLDELAGPALALVRARAPDIGSWDEAGSAPEMQLNGGGEAQNFLVNTNPTILKSRPFVILGDTISASMRVSQTALLGDTQKSGTIWLDDAIGNNIARMTFQLVDSNTFGGAVFRLNFIRTEGVPTPAASSAFATPPVSFPLAQDAEIMFRISPDGAQALFAMAPEFITEDTVPVEILPANLSLAQIQSVAIVRTDQRTSMLIDRIAVEDNSSDIPPTDFWENLVGTRQF